MVCLVLLLAACGDPGENVKKGDKDYPEANPDPKKFMMMHGTIDMGLSLTFRAEWIATSQSCRYAKDGVTSPFSAFTPLVLDRKKEGFTTEIAIDGVVPGRCGWTFDGVTAVAQTGNGTPLVKTHIGSMQLGASPNGVINLQCTPIMRKKPKLTRDINCDWDRAEDPNASVRGGVLWWRPETTEAELHIRKGVCRPGPDIVCMNL